MRAIETLQEDYYYHIYNRGNNGENLFYSDENYHYFLKLYQKYIYPIAETFAWCLLKNHFHFLVKIKDDITICNHFSIVKEQVPKKISQQFSNLFNAYVQAINKQNKRHGSLLETPFKRKQIKDENYLKNLILYIHNNPIQHNFVENLKDYKWSSYASIISNKKSLIERKFVIELFENQKNFIATHQQKVDVITVEKFLKIN